MCKNYTSSEYGCDGNGYLRRLFAESLNCKCTPEAMAYKTPYHFSSDEAAIVAMCKS